MAQLVVRAWLYLYARTYSISCNQYLEIVSINLIIDAEEIRLLKIRQI